MTDFRSLKEYLHAIRSHKGPTILPLQMVADHFGLTRAAVDRMLKPEVGQLRAIRIDGTRFVDARSLIELEESKRSDIQQVRDYLETRARGGQQSVFYEPVMDLIGRKPGVPADRGYIGWILGKISEETNRENGTLLSVLVHRKTAGRTRPGPGFFELAKMLKRHWQDNDAFVETETRKVLRHYRSRTA